MNHIDCKYYLATDAFKGLCKRTKNPVNADEPACSDFEKAPKCRHCKNFSAKTDFMGLCMHKVEAYPDMQALTCTDFTWS